MTRITKQQLAHNLNRAIRCNVGERGINILLYGWMKHRHFGHKYRKALYNRPWLYITEALDFSDYAGYDLTVFPS